MYVLSENFFNADFLFVPSLALNTKLIIAGFLKGN